MRGGARVCECGSSLFGFIEEVIAADHVFADGKNIETIKGLKYLGSDISEMMNRGAETMHPGIDFIFSTAETASKLIDEIGSIGLFYGLSVSLRYALRHSADLIKVAENSGLVMLNRLSMSRRGDEERVAGTGKYAYVMSADELKKQLAASGMTAMYTTDNMQADRDGADTVRASLVISKDVQAVRDFTRIYDSCIDMSVSAGVLQKKGEWRTFAEL